MKSIFISSTFEDMQTERDIIHSIVMPEVNEFAKQYGESVSITDLRWGINTTEMEDKESSKKVLNVCLDEIDDSRPYIIVLLGDRYGWVPEDISLIEDVIETKNKQIDKKYAPLSLDISVTNLEIDYGAFFNQNETDCLFYIRKSIPKEVLGNKADSYISSSKSDKEKLEKLKNKILETYPNNTKYYEATWNKEKQEIDNLTDFANTMIEDIKNMLESEWGKAQNLPWQEKDKIEFDYYINTKASYFVKRRKLTNEVIAFINNKKKPVLFLKGKSGSGKSSFACGLIKQINEYESWTTISYFVGLTKNSNSSINMMKYFIYQLEKLLEIENHYEDANEENTVQKLREKFTELVLQYVKEKDKKLVFVIDGIEQFVQTETEKRLEWLPIQFQSNKIKIVATTIDEYKLPNFVNSYIVENIEEMADDVKDEDFIKEIINSILDYYNKGRFSKSVEDEILEKKNYNNLLYINLIMQLLLMFDRKDFKNIKQLGTSESDKSKVIDNYMIETIKQAPDDLEKLSKYVLMKSAGKINENMADDIFNLISATRNGLRETDIEAIFKKYNSEYNRLEFSIIQKYLSAYLIKREDGRIAFSHKVIKDGFYNDLSDRDKEAYNNMIYIYLCDLDNRDALKKSEYIYQTYKAEKKEELIYTIVIQQYKDELDNYNTYQEVLNIIIDDNKWVKDVATIDLENMVNDSKYAEPIKYDDGEISKETEGEILKNKFFEFMYDLYEETELNDEAITKLISIYEAIYEKFGYNELILERLADAKYALGEYDTAEKYYSIIANELQKEIYSNNLSNEIDEFNDTMLNGDNINLSNIMFKTLLHSKKAQSINKKLEDFSEEEIFNNLIRTKYISNKILKLLEETVGDNNKTFDMQKVVVEQSYYGIREENLKINKMYSKLNIGVSEKIFIANIKLKSTYEFLVYLDIMFKYAINNRDYKFALTTKNAYLESFDGFIEILEKKEGITKKESEQVQDVTYKMIINDFIYSIGTGEFDKVLKTCSSTEKTLIKYANENTKYKARLTTFKETIAEIYELNGDLEKAYETYLNAFYVRQQLLYMASEKDEYIITAIKLAKLEASLNKMIRIVEIKELLNQLIDMYNKTKSQKYLYWLFVTVEITNNFNFMLNFVKKIALENQTKEVVEKIINLFIKKYANSDEEIPNELKKCEEYMKKEIKNNKEPYDIYSLKNIINIYYYFAQKETKNKKYIEKHIQYAEKLKEMVECYETTNILRQAQINYFKWKIDNDFAHINVKEVINSLNEFVAYYKEMYDNKRKYDSIKNHALINVLTVIKEMLEKLTKNQKIVKESNSLLETVNNILDICIKEETKGSISLINLDQKDEPIRGEKFDLIRKENMEVVASGSTSIYGTIDFYLVPIGDYILRKVESEEEYIPVETEMEFSVLKDEKTKLEFRSTRKMATLTLIIVDDFNKPIKGAKFEIYNAGGYKEYEPISNEQGKIELELTYGVHYFEQIDTPIEYIKTPTRFRLRADDENRTFTKKIVNDTKKGSVILLVTDKENKPVPDIVYDIVDKTGRNLGTITTKQNGMAGVIEQLPFDKYYIYPANKRENALLQEFIVKEDKELHKISITRQDGKDIITDYEMLQKKE